MVVMVVMGVGVLFKVSWTYCNVSFLLESPPLNLIASFIWSCVEFKQYLKSSEIL